MGIVSRGGKATTFTGLTAGAWSGEGSMLKNETPALRCHRAARDARVDGPQYVLLAYENSAAFNRLLVTRRNERLGQFIGLVEYGRTLDATSRA